MIIFRPFYLPVITLVISRLLTLTFMLRFLIKSFPSSCMTKETISILKLLECLFFLTICHHRSSIRVFVLKFSELHDAPQKKKISCPVAIVWLRECGLKELRGRKLVFRIPYIKFFVNTNLLFCLFFKLPRLLLIVYFLTSFNTCYKSSHNLFNFIFLLTFHTWFYWLYARTNRLCLISAKTISSIFLF